MKKIAWHCHSVPPVEQLKQAMNLGLEEEQLLQGITRSLWLTSATQPENVYRQETESFCTSPAMNAVRDTPAYQSMPLQQQAKIEQLFETFYAMPAAHPQQPSVRPNQHTKDFLTCALAHASLSKLTRYISDQTLPVFAIEQQGPNIVILPQPGASLSTLKNTLHTRLQDEAREAGVNILFATATTQNPDAENAEDWKTPTLQRLSQLQSNIRQRFQSKAKTESWAKFSLKMAPTLRPQTDVIVDCAVWVHASQDFRDAIRSELKEAGFENVIFYCGPYQYKTQRIEDRYAGRA